MEVEGDLENDSEDHVEAEEEELRDYEEDLLIGIQRTQAISLTAIVCVSFLGNVFVLCSLSLTRYSSRPSRQILKHLLAHISIGDLAYAVLTILPRTVNILTFPRFYGGFVVCRMVKFLQLVPVYVCPFLAVGCILERYSSMKRSRDQFDIMANRRRISWRENRSFVHVLAFWAWLSALVLSAPNILAFRYEYLDDAGTIGACVYSVRESYERVWMTFLTFATWIIPCLIVLTLSTAMLVRYYSKNHRRKGIESDTRARQKMEGEHMRVVNFFLTVILLKFILWTPFNVTNLIGSHWKSIRIDENISVAVTLASNCSCCVPAVAYVFFDYNYIRENILGIISRCTGKDDLFELVRRKSVAETWNEQGAAANLIHQDAYPVRAQRMSEPRKESAIDKSLATFTV